MTILQFLNKNATLTNKLLGVRSYSYNEYTIHYSSLIRSVMIYKGFVLVMEAKRLKDLKFVLNVQ
jgi:hypothetical protein